MKLVMSYVKFPQAPFARAPFGECQEQSSQTSSEIARSAPELNPSLWEALSCQILQSLTADFFSIFRAQTLTPKIDNACISEKPWPVPARAAFAPRWAPALRNECSPPETGCATRCEPPQAEVLRTSQRQRQTGATSPRPEGSGLVVALPRGGGEAMGRGGRALWGGLRGGGSPPADFSIPAGGFSGGFFWRIFPVFCDQKKSTAKSTAPWRVLVSEIPRPWGTRNSPASPPRESKSKSCAFGSGTVTFQGGSFQEKTPGLIGPRNLRILIGRIAVGWPCMECHVPCHISIHWVWDSVKQSEGWGRNTALIARSPTRHSNIFIEKFHHKSSLLVWLPNGKLDTLGWLANSFSEGRCLQAHDKWQKVQETVSCNFLRFPAKISRKLRLPNTGKCNSKWIAIEISDEYSGLCHVVCAYKTRSNKLEGARLIHPQPKPWKVPSEDGVGAYLLLA